MYADDHQPTQEPQGRISRPQNCRKNIRMVRKGRLSQEAHDQNANKEIKEIPKLNNPV